MTQKFLFTYDNYLNMTQRLRDRGYEFAFFPDSEALLESNRPFVLMRHDVDLDLDKALRMSDLEAEAGIKATYFFLVRTDHYNVFSRTGTDTVARILSAGHHLGLHFDCAAYPQDASVDDLARACALEADMLQNWFGREVTTVSYHRPGPAVLSGDPALSAPRPHTYMKRFTENVKYFSDSRGQWGHGCPTDSPAFEQGRPLHILAHPVWWNRAPKPAYDTLFRLCERKHKDLDDSVAQNCAVFRERPIREC